LAARSTIVYADLDLAAPPVPSAVARDIARQARDSLAAGQYDVMLKELSAAEVRDAVRAMPAGHERLALDYNMILLGPGAMLAHAPYRARVVLTGDPFAGADSLGQCLALDADTVRVRLHDCLVSAEKIICLGSPAFEAVAPLVAARPQDRMFPPMALTSAGAQQAPLLVVANEDERAEQDMLTLLRETFPAEEFRGFDPASVFDRPWKAMLQLGIARSSLPGARLSDAWAGGVPVLQLVNRTSVVAQGRRLAGALSEYVVDHGKTGLLFSAMEDLLAALRDLLFDPLPARSVARGARRRVDPAAQWELLLKAVLQ